MNRLLISQDFIWYNNVKWLRTEKVKQDGLQSDVFSECLTAYYVGSSQVSFMTHIVLIFLETITQEQKTEAYRGYLCI